MQFETKARRGLRAGAGVAFALLGLVWLSFRAEAVTGAPEELTLADLRQRVLARNESIQLKLLELEIARRGHRGALGAFEPELVLSAEHQDNQRETTAQERITAYPSIFTEQNNIYDAGIESLIPTGAKIRLGANMRDLVNNIQPLLGNQFTNGEYVTFVGASVVQPLLKNAGWSANLAKIRLAAISSDLAFQDYRRGLMLTLSTAEAAYWNLYLAQQQSKAIEQSVSLAETLLHDNTARRQIGRGSEMEVLEARAGLAVRLSKQAEARQNTGEAMNRLVSLYSETVQDEHPNVVALDPPGLEEVPLAFDGRWRAAFDRNPDYLAQRQRLTQDDIQIAYAKNQRLPQLDLKASYGLNGLGETPGRSWEDIQRQGFPSWSVGVELRLPLGGGIKARHELAVTKLRRQQSLVSLKQIEVQIANALRTAILKTRSSREDVRNYRTVVAYNEDLLATRLAQLKSGRVGSRKVLEVEADLSNARIALTEAKVRYRRALLELELVDGSLLETRHLDLTRKELEQCTVRLLQHGNITGTEFHQFVNSVQAAYHTQWPPNGPPAPAETTPPE